MSSTCWSTHSTHTYCTFIQGHVTLTYIALTSQCRVPYYVQCHVRISRTWPTARDLCRHTVAPHDHTHMHALTYAKSLSNSSTHMYMQAGRKETGSGDVTFAGYLGRCMSQGTVLHPLTWSCGPTAYLSNIQTLSGTPAWALQRRSNGVICYRRSLRVGGVRKLLCLASWCMCVFGKMKAKNILKPLA